MAQVQAEFDFEAQSGSSELSLTAGEILTVLQDNVEGGWMEGKNARGKIGLFPASYVIPYHGPPAGGVPPPAPPPQPFYPPLPKPAPASFDDWGSSSFGTPPPPVVAPVAAPPSHGAPSSGGSGGLANLINRPPSRGGAGDDFDDDWSDEEEEEEQRMSVQEEIANMAIVRARAIQRAAAASRERGLYGDSRTDVSTDGGEPVSTSLERRMMRARRRSSGRTDRFIGNGGTANDKDHPPSRSTSGSVVPRDSVSRSHSAGNDRTVSSSGGKIKGNINIFSNFVKSGMEAYVLSADTTKGQPGERHEIVIVDGLVRWRTDSKPYVCSVDKPKKETKMKGLKSFIAYSITSSLSGIQVSRRYKHFDWLHEILSAKYITIALPPLPEKQVSGRYEEDLIDHRKRILQLWVDRICRHPVLSKSDVWLHFLTCTDEKQWKTGKRKAERDEYVGGAFLNCVTSPDAPLNPNDVERQVEMFSRNVRQMEEGTRIFTERLNTYERLLVGPVKQNWQKLAAAFSSLGHAFKDDGAGAVSHKMADALQRTAHHYHIIGDDYEEHAKKDVEPVLERLYSYRGTIAHVPDIVNIHKQAITKWRNSENAVVEGKISENQAVKVKQRVDNTSYVILAEVNHIQAEKTEDFKQFLAVYLRKQQAFYQNMANTLGDLAKEFE